MQIFSEQARAFPSALKRRGVARQNGFRRGKQSYRCKNCGCQYVEHPKPKGYLPEVKQRACVRVLVCLADTGA